METPEFQSDAVRAAFDAFPSPARTGLLDLRRLIFEAGEHAEGAGAISEALKWGQPAYLTPDTKSGSTIRLGIPASTSWDYALFVHCQTDLTRQFETHYPGLFVFEGTRAVLFSAGKPIQENAIRHCLGMALTYHPRKRADFRRAG